MHFATSSWSLADALWNFDPFTRVEFFGPVLSDFEASPMSSWFETCSKPCCACEYI